LAAYTDQAASGFNFNPNAFITFKIALKLGLPFFEREFADTPPPAPDQVRGVLPRRFAPREKVVFLPCAVGVGSTPQGGGGVSAGLVLQDFK
jgi:hypothetical protein